MAEQLKNVFGSANEPITGRSISLGPLLPFAPFFPAAYATSLCTLAALRSSTRPPTTEASLQVNLGVGQTSDDDKLYSFLDSMLIFQSKDKFNAVLRHGYSLCIRGGTHQEIVAAVIFIASIDGLFIDVIAVAHGHAPGACRLAQSLFCADTDAQRSLIEQAVDGSFQNLGLGGFLLALVAQCAILKCTPNAASVFLKANADSVDFYEKRGFSLVSSDTPLPLELSRCVPSANYQTLGSDTVLLRLRGAGPPTPSSSPGPRNKHPAQKTVIATQTARLARTPPPDSDTTPPLYFKDDTEKKAYYKKKNRDKKKRLAREKKAELARLEKERLATELSSSSSSSSESDPEGKPKGKPKAKEPPTPPKTTKPAPAARKLRSQQSPPSKRKASDKGSKNPQTNKLNSNKRRKLEQALVTKMETCEIDTSDESGAEFDYDNYATATTPTMGTGSCSLPIKDFWEPQDQNNKKFRADEPEPSHQLTQKEMYARYPLQTSPRAFGRSKIMQQAAYYKTETKLCQSQDRPRYNIEFEDQDYIDYACVADMNRPIAVVHGSYNPAEQLLAVKVSSYKLTKNDSLRNLKDNRNARNRLDRMERTVEVDLKWLKSTCRPMISQVIDEMALGSTVTRVGGANIGTADPFSLSFSGTTERVKGFLALPQGQEKVFYKVKQPAAPDVTEPDKREVWYDLQHKVTERMRNLQKTLHLEHGLEYAPPPPEDTTQIVRLKWLPSKKDGSKRDDGIWHGLFVVDMGEAKANSTQQECSLTTEWVESAFTLAFRKECKSMSAPSTIRRNEKKFLYIPAGDARTNNEDRPVSHQLLTEVRVKYQQGSLDSCLRHSMSSAIHAMGFIEEAKLLAREDGLSGSTVGLLAEAAQFVRKVFRKSNLVLMKVAPTMRAVDQVSQEDPRWPLVLALEANDGSSGSHAITTWNGMIFDSNLPSALRWTQRSLDWCSGNDSTCVGFSNVYRLCPPDFGHMLPESTLRVGTWIQPHSEGPGAPGWIKSLPTKKANGQQKKGYIVAYPDGRKTELSALDVSEYAVKD